MKWKTWRQILGAGLVLAGAATAEAQDWDKVEVRAEPVRDGIYVLYGRGGNIGVSIGDDGVILVDDQYAPLTDKVKAAVAELSDKPIRYVINTHFHDDHTGGNENLGDNTVIVAHDNVRQRLSQGAFVKAFNKKMPPLPGVALPKITFSAEMSLYINGEEARIIHAKHAHTDGDSFIWFKGSDVLHMGDLMFNGMFPFIDVSNGGDVDGVIDALNQAIEIAGDNTKVIPGHGPATDKQGLIAYRDTIAELRAIVAKLKAEGKSLEEVKAMSPFKAYEDTLAQFMEGWANEVAGFMYESL